MIKVLIADDHPIVREGIRQVLAESSFFEASDEASNGQEVLDKVREKSFDIVLLDISMPGRGGLEVLKELKAEKPDIPVLILTIHPEEQYATRALKAGAAGYLTKEHAPEELVTAIKRIVSGRKYITPSLAEKLADVLTGEAEESLHASLSDREYQVLLKIASGKGISAIADELNLSVKTISTYRSRILEKMKMSSNAALTRYAIINQLVD